MTTGAVRFADMSQRIRDLLQAAGESFQPDNLSRIDRAEMQAVLLRFRKIENPDVRTESPSHLSVIPALLTLLQEP
jgi:hypothetical protein